jgi:hypothetical protein
LLGELLEMGAERIVPRDIWQSVTVQRIPLTIETPFPCERLKAFQ